MIFLLPLQQTSCWATTRQLVVPQPNLLRRRGGGEKIKKKGEELVDEENLGEGKEDKKKMMIGLKKKKETKSEKEKCIHQPGTSANHCSHLCDLLLLVDLFVAVDQLTSYCQVCSSLYFSLYAANEAQREERKGKETLKNYSLSKLARQTCQNKSLCGHPAAVF